MPEIALPVRVHECRGFGGAEERSFETTVAGLVTRLDENENLEPGYPKTGSIRYQEMDMKVKIYAFKPGKAETYLDREGVIFTINGQAHGHLPNSFFARPKAVGLQRLKDSLLVIVDCSKLGAVHREDLFMTSRDRLSEKPIRYGLEREIEILLKESHELKKLQQERRQQSIEDQLHEEKPLEEVLGKVLRASPSLNTLFLKGERISRAFPGNGKGVEKTSGGEPGKGPGNKEFLGVRHPTFFKFYKLQQGKTLKKYCEEKRRCRAKFETDVVDDYFDRASDKGVFVLERILGEKGSESFVELDRVISLDEGIAYLNFDLPEGVKIAEKITLRARVTDPTLTEPYDNFIELEVIPRQKRPGGGKRKKRDKHGGSKQGFQMPKVIPVKEGDVNWLDMHFKEKTSCKVISEQVKQAAETFVEHCFYINMDNSALKNEMKYSKQNAKLMEAKFKYANVMVGLGLLHEFDNGGAGGDDEHDKEGDKDVHAMIETVSSAMAPFFLPMIDQLSGLDEADYD